MESKAQSGWNTFARVNASQRWRRPSAAMGRSATDAIVTEARVQNGMCVLDIASGSGEPAITIATLLNGTGRVIATDISPAPLKVAHQRASERGLANIEFLPADVHQLPFPDATFDRVVCRLGLMFFADLPRALVEIRRVLKSGGRVSVLAWGPMQQPYFDVPIGTILRNCPELGNLARNVPMFKFAEPESLSSALVQAGFESVQNRAQSIPWNWPDTPEELWDYFREVTIPFKPLFEAIPPKQRDRVSAEVIDGLRERYDGQRVTFDASMVLASAVKP